MKVRIVCAVFMLAPLLVGCTPDPVASFRALVESLPVPYFDSPTRPRRCGSTALVDLGFDVRVTDSLVSPYLGIVTFTYTYVRYATTPSTTGKSTVTATYAFQGGEWVEQFVEVEGMLAEWCILRWSGTPQ